MVFRKGGGGSLRSNLKKCIIDKRNRLEELMKKKKIIMILGVILFLVVIFGIILWQKSARPFRLESKYYEKSEYLDLDKEKFEQLTGAKESFVVFICQDLCANSAEFNKLLDQFLAKHQMTIYKMYYSDVEETTLGEKIKYYPSFVIFRKGKIVDFLSADKDEHIKVYQDANEFEKWLAKYIALTNAQGEKEQEEKEVVKGEISTKVDDLKYNENKVNIYLFWGDGCPRCSEAQQFFKEIEAEYGKYYTLNGFEVWYDKENQKLFQEFASAMGDEAKGVPYIVIGRETFIGFGEVYEEKIKEAIKSQYKNSYDVYFNKN